MGDEEIERDPTETTASQPPVDPVPADDPQGGGAVHPDDLWMSPSTSDDDAALWDVVRHEGDPDDLWGPAESEDHRPSHHRLRIALGVSCLVIAAIIAAVVVLGGDDPEPRTSSATTTSTAATGAATATSSGTPAEPGPGGMLVPSTVPEGAVVKCGSWDAAASFAPDPLPDGVVIWSDFDGWHVRSSGAEAGTVTGRITGTVRPNIIDQPEPERVDASAPPDGSDLYFTIRPGDEPQGFDFTASCAQKAFTFELKSDAQAMDPKLVHLGRAGGVAAVPFVVSRIPEPG